MAEEIDVRRGAAFGLAPDRGRPMADLNGDGKADLICRVPLAPEPEKDIFIDYSNSAGTYTGTNWSTNMSFCNRSNDELYVGDFNGDGKADLLCHDPTTGHLAIDFADSGGYFGGLDWQRNADWCISSSRMSVGDFNGDGRDDILCHIESAGTYTLEIDYYDLGLKFTGPDWTRRVENAIWCTTGLLVGDFNGDSRDDLLCLTGTSWRVHFASSSGRFGSSDVWNKNHSRPCVSWRAHIGDFNGDGRDDVLCEEEEDANGDRFLSIDYWNWLPIPISAYGFAGTDWRGAANWCHHAGSELHVGDFNGDGRDDLLCHDVDDGYKWIDYADSNGRFGGTDWELDSEFCTADFQDFR
jgi:hypothetical protein